MARNLRRLGLATLLMLCCLSAPAQAAEPLVGEWHLDEKETFDLGSRDVTPDSSGFGNELEGPYLGIALGPGRWVQGLTEANSWALGTAEDAPELRPQRVTLVAWVKRVGASGGNQLIAGQLRTHPSSCGVYSYALASYASESGGQLMFSMALGEELYVASPVASNTGVWDGNWHMLAGTFDGSRARLYVDGAEVGSGTPAPQSSIDYGSEVLPFAVDGHDDYPGCTGEAGFTGSIDEVRVYNRALTGTEIARMALPSSPTPPALVPDGSEPPPSPPIPLKAEMASPGTAGSTRVIDVSATRGSADIFKYDVNGDKKPDVTCPGSQPYLGVTTPTAAKSTVTVTAFAGARASSTALPNLFMPGRSLPAAVAKTVPTKAVCTSSIAMLSPLAVLSQCVSSTVIFKLVEAQGCFMRIQDEDGIPAAEEALIRKHYESLLYPPVVFVLCRQEAAGKAPKGKCDQAKKALRRNIDVYVSKQAVKMNGITITPRNGKSVVVFPAIERVVSADAVAKWGGMTVRMGSFDLNLADVTKVISFKKDWAAGRSAPIAYYDGRKDIPDIAGFKLNGSVELALQGVNGQRFSAGTLSLQLPGEFKVFNGNPPSGTTRLLGNNSQGVIFDSLDVSVPEAHFGGVRLADVRFRYALHGGIDANNNPNSNCTRKEWKAQARIYLAGGKSGETGFNLAPPPSQNGVGFCNGGFRHAGGQITFGGPIPPPQLFPGVFLQQVNFALQLRPTLVRGGAGVSAAKIARVDGAVLMALASPWEPYTLTPADAGNEFRQLAGRRFTSTTIAAGGAVWLKFPGVGEVPVGNAAVMWSYPDYFFGSGEVRVGVPGMAVYGRAGITARFNQGLFDSHIGGGACLAGIKGGACIGADGWVSSKGMVACLNILGTFHPGAGITWATRKVEVWPLDGCKPSRYWVSVTPAQARAAANRLTFTVARGERVKNVKIRGRGGAPLVEVRAPGGETLTLDGDEGSSAHMGGLRHTVNGVAYVGVKNGPPGTYTVTALPGSADLAGLDATRPGYDSDFSAKVTGRGAVRTLAYDARKPSGQRVTFYERGTNIMKPIKTATGGRGTVRFRPSVGAGGRRQIVAQATIRGTAVRPQVLASFDVAASRRPSRPRRVQVRRRGERLTIGWSRVAGATRYGIVVKYSSGRERQIQVGPRRRSLRLKFPLTEGGRVLVSARGVLEEWGRPRASARLKAVRRAPRALQDDRHNQRRTALLQKRKAAAKRKQG